jgi:hypothetical protein
VKLPFRRRPLSGDLRAQGLVASLWLLYQELEPGDQLVGISIQALSGGQIVTYGLSAGSDRVIRFVTDPEDLPAAADALDDLFGGVIRDATVPDAPP